MIALVIREGQLGRAGLSRLRAIAGGIFCADSCLADKVRPVTGGKEEMSESPESAAALFWPHAFEPKQFCGAESWGEYQVLEWRTRFGSLRARRGEVLAPQTDGLLRSSRDRQCFELDRFRDDFLGLIVFEDQRPLVIDSRPEWLHMVIHYENGVSTKVGSFLP